MLDTSYIVVYNTNIVINNKLIIGVKKMKIEEWESLKDSRIEYRAEWLKFMYDPANKGKCRSCPENKGFDNDVYPCGQQNCWVTMHCQ